MKAITHPVNAFLLIKEMIMDWNKVIEIMRFNTADDFIHNVTQQRIDKRINYPTEVLFFLPFYYNFLFFQLRLIFMV